uniref:YtxH domain-containing protein n=1 Tax=Rhodopseudomonas palustris (strain BisA53) TaxID=316055 RepID=Q07JT3_RHOP5
MSDHNDHPSAAGGQPQPGFAPGAAWPYPPPPGYPQPGAWGGPPPWAGAAPYPHHAHPHGGWHGHAHPAYAAGPWWGYAPAAHDPKVGPASHQHHAQHHDLIAGLVVGAAAAYLLSNEKVQSTVLRTAVSLWATVQGGLEEMKERIRDAEAEVAAAKGSAEDGAGAKPE